ncbi:MAG: hypothetical protein AAGI11_00015 [Pseudomonadota bacterium]
MRAGALTLALVAMPSLADLTIEQETKLRAGGMLSMLSTDITSTTQLSGDRARTVSKPESKSGFMKMLGASQETVTILRLDKGVAWQLMPKDKQYTETSLSELGEQYEAASRQMSEAQGGGGAVASDDACTLSPPKVYVDETRKKRTIAGIEARQFIVRVEQTCEMPEREQVCEIQQTWESWLASEFPQTDEVKSFQRELAKQSAMFESSINQTPATAMFAAMFGDAWEAASGEASDLEGYPMESNIKLEFGGPNCQGLAELQAATAELLESAKQAGIDGAMGEAAAQAGSETAKQTQGMFGDSVAEQIAGAGVGRAAGEMVSGLFGGLRKMAKKPSESGASTGSKAELVFEISTTVKSVGTNSISAGSFDLPTGYKLVASDAPF